LEEQSAALLDGIVSAVPAWVQRCVESIAIAYWGEADDSVRAAAAAAGLEAQRWVSARLEELLGEDIDLQRTTPLSILRSAVRFPTAVLREAGVPPVVRDDFAEAAFPDDLYGLSPASLRDLDPGLVDVGIAWGAAKAMAHRRRHAGGG
jgi:hypothetical protein